MEDEKKRQTSGTPKSETFRLPFALVDLDREIKRARGLTEEAAQLICEIEELAALIEAQLMRSRLARVLPFPIHRK